MAGRLALLGAALVALAIGSSSLHAQPIPSRAPTNQPFRVWIGDQPVIVSPGEVASWADPGPPKNLPVRGGGQNKLDLISGTTTLALIDHLGVPHDAVNSITVFNSIAGTTVGLSADEALGKEPGAFDEQFTPDCGTPCLATINADSGGSTEFYRPLRSAADENRTDNLHTGGETFDISIDLKPVREFLDVQLTCLPYDPRVGQTVTLAVKNPQPGVAYKWYFGDGATDTTNSRTVTHAYAAGGPYWPSVVATRGDAIQAQACRVQVRGGDEQPANSGSGATTPAGAPPSRTSGGGGGTDSSKGQGRSNAPADGARDPKVVGGRGTTGGAGRPNSTAKPNDATPTTPLTPAATAAPTPAPSPAPSPAPTPTPTPAPGAAGANPKLPPGLPISGQLVKPSNAGKTPSLQAALTAADALARDDSPAPAQARSGAGGGWSIVGSAGSGMLIAGLLAAGAAVELRRSRRDPLI